MSNGYEIVLDASQPINQVQSLSGKVADFDAAIKKLGADFVKLTDITRSYNDAGQVTNAVMKGIDESGRKFARTISLMTDAHGNLIAKVKGTNASLSDFSSRVSDIQTKNRSLAASIAGIAGQFKNLGNVDSVDMRSKLLKTLGRFSPEQIAAEGGLSGAMKGIDTSILPVASALRQVRDEYRATEEAAVKSSMAQKAAQQKVTDEIRKTMLADAEQKRQHEIYAKLTQMGLNYKSAAHAAGQGAALGMNANQVAALAKAGPGHIPTLQQAGLFNTLQQATTHLNAANNAAGQLNVTLGTMVRFFALRTAWNFADTIRQGLVEGTQRAIEFEQKVSQILTIAEPASRDFDRWADSVKKLSSEFGAPALDIAEAYYSAVSNQIGNTVQEIESYTRATLAFATVTKSTAKESNDLMSSAINAFHLSAYETEKIAASFYQTINLGRVTAHGMSQTFGRVAVSANAVGVSLNELQAALATLSIQGVTDADAMTQMTNVFNKLMKPTEHMQELIRSWGFETGESAVKTLGFTKVLGLMNDELAKGGTSRLAAEMGDIRAIRGVLGLSGTNAATYQDYLRQISNADNDYLAAKKVSVQSAGKVVAVELEKLNTMMLSVGEKIVGVLANMNNYIGGLTNLLVRWKTSITVTAAALVGVGGFVASVYVTAQALTAVKTAIAAVRTAWLAMNAAMIFTPVGIALSAVGLLAGGLLYMGTRAQLASEDYTQMAANIENKTDGMATAYARHLTAVRMASSDMMHTVGAVNREVVKGIYEDLEAAQKTTHAFGAGLQYLQDVANRIISASDNDIKKSITSTEAALTSLKKHSVALREAIADDADKRYIETANTVEKMQFYAKHISDAAKELRDASSEDTTNILDKQRRDVQEFTRLEAERVRQLGKAQKELETIEQRISGLHGSNTRSEDAELARLSDALRRAGKNKNAIIEDQISAVRALKKLKEEDAQDANRNERLKQLQDKRAELLAEMSQLNKTVDIRRSTAEFEASVKEKITAQEHALLAKREQLVQIELAAEAKRAAIRMAFEQMSAFTKKEAVKNYQDAGGTVDTVRMMKDYETAKQAFLSPLGDDATFQQALKNVNMEGFDKSVRSMIEAAAKLEESNKRDRDVQTAQTNLVNAHKALVDKIQETRSKEKDLLDNLDKRLKELGLARGLNAVGGVLASPKMMRDLAFDPNAGLPTGVAAELLKTVAAMEDLKRTEGRLGDANTELVAKIGSQMTAADLNSLRLQENTSETDKLTKALQDATDAYMAALLVQGAPTQRAQGGALFSTDSINAVLSRGEFVVNADAARRNSAFLTQMNSNSTSNGGTQVGNITVNYNATGHGVAADARGLATEIRRNIRAGRFAW